MKKSKIIAPALGVLILSTAASISGTVAWFTANNSVSVTGMSVRTKVSSNLMVYEDVLTSNALTDDQNFSTEDITTAIKGVLEPASTINGHDFYYTTNAKGDGDSAAETYTLYNASTAATNTTNYANAFSEAYDVTKSFASAYTGSESLNAAVPFVDYALQIKAVNADSVAKYLCIKNLTLKYSAATDTNKAFRVAISLENITSANPAGDFKATADGIFAPSTAQNFSDANSKNYAVGATAVDNTDPENPVQPVKQLAVAGNKYNNTDIGKLAQVIAGDTQYFKLVARLYLEGEDKTCTNDTFAALTGEWSLQLDLELNTGVTAGTDYVTALTMDVTSD